jgi:23S rRNA pseudouridine2605 synthase
VCDAYHGVSARKVVFSCSLERKRIVPPRNHQPRKSLKSPAKRPRPARAPSKPKAPTGDAHASTASGERLQKVLAQAGIASRRECEELIREGRVEVDRKVVTELGTRVDPLKQEIRLDGEALTQSKLVYFAINKPTGIVSTSSDPAGRPRVIDLLPPNIPRVFCVGRLDVSSEGLILATNDGELTNGLTHPRHGVEKIYHVQVAGEVGEDVIAKLKRGVHLAEGFAHVKHVRIKSKRKRSSILEMILDEGRNREVRRLLARVGHKVQQLKRIAVGPVRLADLPTGAVRPLTNKEVQSLQLAVSRGPQATSPGRASESKRPSAPRKAGKKPGIVKDHKEKRTVIG